jgi:uncharacterized protein with HEPN domain
VRRDVEWLADILDAIDAIERYTKSGDEEFRQSELLQIWVVHHLQVIGEAAARSHDPSSPRLPMSHG